MENIKGVTKEIHGLVNNAGVMAPRDYLVSKHGIESQFAVNHVGHFLLTNLLIQEGLVGGQGTTIVNVSSLGYQLAEANLEDPNFQVSFIRTAIDDYGTQRMKLMYALGRTAKHTTGGALMDNPKQPTYSSHTPWVKSLASTMSLYSLFTLVVGRPRSLCAPSNQ